MTVLAMGLLCAGIGTVPVLRTTLVGSIDSTLTGLAASPVVQNLFVITPTDDSGVTFTVKKDAPGTDYYVAMYGPEGEFLTSGGGQRDSVWAPPDFPEEFKLDSAYAKQDQIFAVPAAKGPGYHAVVSTVQVTGTNLLYTQLIAMPLEDADNIVATFFGVFILVALVTILAGAFLTRWLVTLAFRRLGQVEATAMTIAAGDFSQRLTDIELSTEVGRLKAAINTMLDRVHASLAQRDASVQQMRRFIGDASHELRTPLVSVRGYAELYRMGAITGDENIAQAMERIEKEATRMGVLVEDLLALARLDERREIDIAPLDLRPIARDAALDLRAAAPARTVTVRDTTVAALTGPIALPKPKVADPSAKSTATSPIARAGALLRRRPKQAEEDASSDPQVEQLDLSTPEQQTTVLLPPIVLGEENRIRQVVANLLGNARRFSPEDSPIEIEVGIDRERDAGWIGIVDHGEGIPEQLREQIFQRFWRADTSRTRETGGSGLGLAIVQSIVESLHGTVMVLDTPGGGATFRVAFPLVQRREAAEHATIATQPMPRLSVDEADAPDHQGDR